MPNLKYKLLGIGVSIAAVLTISACSSQSKPATTTEKSEVKTLSLSGDIISEKNGCVLQNRFSPGDKMVFRMDAVDPNTNKQDQKAKLVLHLSTGETVDFKLGHHPPKDNNGPQFWTAAYEVKSDTPTGTLDYYVTAEDGDKKGEFKPFNMKTSLPTIVNDQSAGNQAQASTTSTVKGGPINQNFEVKAKNFQFDKKEYHVKAGQEVTLKFTSEEGTHGLTIEGVGVDIKAPGGTVKFTPQKAGQYKMFCNVYCGDGHGNMNATLVVE